METRETAGVALIGSYEYIRDHIPKTDLEMLLRRLPAGQVEQLDALDRRAWYPQAWCAALWSELFAYYDDEEAGYRALADMGKHISSAASTTFLRLLIKILTPKLFARKFPAFYGKYQRGGGRLEVDTSRFDEQRFSLALRDIGLLAPTMGGVATGWIEYAFGQMERKVEVDWKRTNDDVEFEISFH